MQDVFVSTVEGWHDVDDNVQKMYKLAQYEFTVVISSSRMLRANKFYMYDLLCHMIPLHALGPILEVHVQLLIRIM